MRASAAKKKQLSIKYSRGTRGFCEERKENTFIVSRN